MKVGIITFHWGGSHGGILQAYATSTFLKKQGIDAFIVDYYPKSKEKTFLSLLRPNRPNVMFSRCIDYLKCKRVNRFRRVLSLSRRYISYQDLKKNPPDADAFITGSDQVWNPYYLMHGENGITPVYYLDFCRTGAKKIAMSVSFGCDKYSTEVIKEAKKLLFDFSAVSVRENSGLCILASMDYHDGILTADPTSLLDAADYLSLCKDIMPRDTGIVEYILHNNKTAKGILGKVKKIQCSKNVTCINNYSVEKWIASLRDCTCVVTNSFHCIMFSLYFHKPFYVVLEQGSLSGMNDRIVTLMKYFNLKSRIVGDEVEIKNIVDIDWDNIDAKMLMYRSSLVNFLLENVV